MLKSIVTKVASVIIPPPNPPPSPTASTSTEDGFYPRRLAFSSSTGSSDNFSSIGNLRSVTREEIYSSASEFENSYLGDERDLNNISTEEESDDTSILFPAYCQHFERLGVYRAPSGMVVGLCVGGIVADVKLPLDVSAEGCFIESERNMDVD
jgi:hypothetical protein